MKRIILLLSLTLTPLLFAGEIEKEGKIYSETFKTLNTHDGFRPPPGLSHFAGPFQKSLKILPESILVTSVLFFVNSAEGVPEKQKKKLNEVFQKFYLEILKDKQMQGIPSALPYSLSDKKLSYGHYFLYLPPEITPQTKQIVFLHGYGGNFLIYIYVLKKAFKNCIIVVPSWGSSWAHGNYHYLQEVYADIKSRHAVKIRQPVLMAISAGGGAAFEYYNENPYRFKSIIGLATCPYQRTIDVMKPGLSIIMICGRYDKRFPWEGVKKRAMQVKKKVKDFKLTAVPDNHFFFLSSEKEWIDFIKKNTNLD
jgi:hypothetical protein